MTDGVVVNGNAYPDELTATAAEHPNLPSELKQVFIGPQEPTGASNTPARTYDTPLSPDQEQAYQAKYGTDPRTTEDYDMRGFYKANPEVDPHTDGTHYPDTFKKPSHPTFSDQSQYHSAETPGGQWTLDETGRDVFTPGPQNVKNGLDVTREYLDRSDPNVLFNIPASTMALEASRKAADALKSSAGSQIPDMTDTYGTPPDKQIWPERMVSGIVNALQLPADVYSGKVPAGSHQEIERAADLAGTMVFGPAPVAKDMAQGTLGSFMGVRSQTFNRAKLQQAQELEANAVHPDDIWKEARTFKAVDGRWKQEIPDEKAVLKLENMHVKDHPPAELDPNTPKGWGVAGDNEGHSTVGIRPSWDKEVSPKSPEEFEKYFRDVLEGSSKPTILKDILHHPELFKAYPELENITIKPLEDYKGEIGPNVLGVNAHDALYMKHLPPEQFRSILLHEIQHSIQEIEGFARGGSSHEFLNPKLAEVEKEFLALKSGMEPEIAKVIPDMDYVKHLLKLSVKSKPFPKVARFLKQIEKDHPLEYSRLKNISESEVHIDTAKQEAYENYRKLMGEVEARIVQARADYRDTQRFLESPMQTEARDTRREYQINPRNVPRYSK